MIRVTDMDGVPGPFFRKISRQPKQSNKLQLIKIYAVTVYQEKRKLVRQRNENSATRELAFFAINPRLALMFAMER